MKKISFILVGSGVLLLVLLSLLFPVPEVEPLREDEEESGGSTSNQKSFRGELKKQTSGGGEGMKAGSFVFPYYATPDADDPLWVVRGTEAMISGKELENVTVNRPSVLYFPNRREAGDGQTSSNGRPSSDGSGTEQKVRIRGQRGEMMSDDRVRLQGDVSVHAGRGGQVQADALFANFKTNRIYTNPEERVTLRQYDMRVTGTGMSARPELSSFRVRRRGELTLSARRLRSPKALQSKPPPSRVRLMNRIYVRNDGRIKGRSRVGDDAPPDQTGWNISLHRNVFLYRIRPSGNYQQRSDRLQMVLNKSAADSASAGGSSSGPPSDDGDSDPRLQLRSMTASGQVRVSDPFFEIRTRQMRVRKQKGRDVIHLDGRQQRIVLKEGVPRPGAPVRDASGNVRRTDGAERTTVWVRGTGKIVRPRPSASAAGPDRSDDDAPPTGTATFDGRIVVNTEQATLQARRLTIDFALPADTSNDGDASAASADRRLSIQSMEATGNVLLLRDQVASTGRTMSLNRNPTTLRIKSKNNSQLVDLRNRIEARVITLNHQHRTLTARGEASATLRSGRVRDLRLVGAPSKREGNEETDATIGTSDPWKIDAEKLVFDMNPANNRLQSVRARKNVQIRAPSGRGYGATFTFDRDSGTATLSGGENTPHARFIRDGNRVVADRMRFHLRRGTVVLKGQKRLRLKTRRRTGRGNRSQETDNQIKPKDPGPDTEFTYLTTGAPAVIHRDRGVLRILGRSTLRRPAGWMRSNRLTMRFDPDTRELRSAVARGHVVVRDRLGALSGDVVWWWPRTERLRVRGRPTARIRRGKRSMAFDEITLLRKTSTVRGRSYGSDRGRASFTASGQLLSAGANRPNDSERTIWHVRARRMSFSIDEAKSTLRTFRARGDVRLTSSKGDARGDRLLYDRAQSRLTLYGDGDYARVHHGPHRLAADRILYDAASRDVVLKGRKKIRLVKPPETGGKQNRKEQSSSDSTSTEERNRRKKLNVRTRAPTVLHRADGVLRILGPSRLYNRSARLRSRGLTVLFDPGTRKLRAVRADEDVFLNHQKGSLYGDQARWNVREERLEVRGQPFVSGLFRNMRFRFELITVSEDWSRFQGRWFKWRRHGTARLRNRKGGAGYEDLP